MIATRLQRWVRRLVIGWQQITTPDVGVTEPDERRQARLLASVTLGMFLILILLFVVRGAFGLEDAVVFVARVVCAVLLLIAFRSSKRGQHRQAFVCTVLVGTLVLLELARQESGSARLHMLNYLSVILLVASLFLSLQTVLQLFALHVVVMFAFAWAVEDIDALAVLDGPFSFNLTMIAAIVLVTAHRNLRESDRQRELETSEVAERSQRKLAEALANTAAAINESLALDEVLDRILENLEQVVPHDTSSIMLVREDRAYVVRSRGFLERDLTFIEDYSAPIQESDNLRRMVETRQPVRYEDAWDFPRFRLKDIPSVIRSYLGVPICRGEEVIGFLNMDGFEPGMFKDEHAQRLTAFADQVSTGIHNARLFEAEARRREIAEALVGAAMVLNSTLDLPTVLEQILAQLQHVVDFDSASILERDGEDLEITGCRGFGVPAEVLGRRFKLAPRLPAWKIFQNRLPLAYTDLLAEHPAFFDHEVTAESGHIRSWLGLPLQVKNRMIGVIALDRFAVKPFTTDDIALAMAVASQAAVAIENARLYVQVHEHAEDLEARIKDRTADLQASEERHRIISELTSDYIYALVVQPDASVALSWTMGAVDRITGYSPAEIEALPGGWNSLVHPDGLAVFELLWPKLLDGQTVVQEYRITTKQGQLRWLRDYKKPVWDEKQDCVTLIWGAVQDITELRERTLQLEAANSELQTLSRVKDEFVSNVSHELRTPITNIKLHQYLLRKRPEKVDVHLDVMGRETERLSRIIEDLLTLSRMDQERVSLRLELVDLNRMAAQYVTDRASLAQSRELTLDMSGEPDAPAVQADLGMLEQAISILLTNALYYTPAGGKISVQVCRRSRADGDWAGIAVKDTGPGIAPKDQKRLFERFYRGSAGKKSGSPGTGLGLAILKEIVDRHHGEVQVDSTGVPGEGAAFTIWLPAASDA